MKKFNFLAISLFIAVSGFSQTFPSRQYEDKYLLSEPFISGCASLDAITEFDCNYNRYPSKNTNVVVCECLKIYNDNDWVIGYYDFAQPFHTDTSIVIQGVSALLFSVDYDDPFHPIDTIYLEIRDSSLNNTYRQYKLKKEDIGCWQYSNLKYTEVFFDEPLEITGDFYVVLNNVWICQGEIHLFGVVNCERTLVPLILDEPYEPDNWHESYVEILDPHQPYTVHISAYYMFPILGEKNTGLSDVDLKNAVSLFPNPAKNEVYVNSQYLIQDIDIYDQVGRMVLSKDIKAYKTNLDIKNLKQGTYIMNINTNNGKAKKKLVVK